MEDRPEDRAPAPAHALEQRLVRLERANDELEGFVATAAHDLREPLRAIAGFVELLRKETDGSLNDRAERFFGMIEHATERMDDLVDALSRFGDAGRGSAHREDIDAAAALDRVLASLAAQIRERGAEITRDDLGVVWADRGGFEQVLQNLISNAIKFNGSERPRVHVALQPHEEGWELVVSDNGIGVPERDRERIFEMWRRLHPRDRYSGTGAGLAICQRVVQRHGGRIWITDVSRGGTSFHVLWPSQPGATG